MLGNFNIPSVDNLREGVDYRVLDWDFSSGSTVPQPPPGQPCPEGTKMIFGMCRKLKSQSGDWNPDEKSDMEKAGEEKAKTAGSSFQNNKQVDVGGKKYGWAMKGGKPVMVEWGSVAGTKPKPNAPAAPAAAAPASASTPAPAPRPPVTV